MILIGQVIDQLATLPDRSVHCAITSVPYWRQRDYGVAGQHGLEDTPEAWVDTQVRVAMAVHRVLRDDGTFWLNVGDKYLSRSKPGGWNGYRYRREMPNDQFLDPPLPLRWPRKSLCLLPAHLSIALQEAGWIIRNKIIWEKTNGMPHSRADALTNRYEEIFCMVKRPRGYYFDHFALRRPHKLDSHRRDRAPHSVRKYPGQAAQSFRPGTQCHPAGAMMGDVWHIATQPCTMAHYATFPEEIPRRCIRAGTSEHGVCATCGAPWVREMQKHFQNLRGDWRNPVEKREAARVNGQAVMAGPRGQNIFVHKGWRPSCTCAGAGITKAVVLDPYAGSGTVGQVAEELNRDYILIDLDPRNQALMEQRIAAGIHTRANGRKPKRIRTNTHQRTLRLVL